MRVDSCMKRKLMLSQHGAVCVEGCDHFTVQAIYWQQSDRLGLDWLPIT